MSLKLPIFATWQRTLAAWKTELTSVGVVTVGRNTSGTLPYCKGGNIDYKATPLSNVGEGWISYTPEIKDALTSTISSIDRLYCRYQIVANTLFCQAYFIASFTEGGGNEVTPIISLPVPLNETSGDNTSALIDRPIGFGFIGSGGSTATLPMFCSVQSFRPTTSKPYQYAYVTIPTGAFAAGVPLSRYLYISVVAEI